MEFGGVELKINTTYFWKVRIWNSRNEPSDYSEIQSFTTGNPAGYQTTANCFKSALNKPALFKKLSAGHYFIDFGKDAFGTFLLNITPLQVHRDRKLFSKSSEIYVDGEGSQHSSLHAAFMDRNICLKDCTGPEMLIMLSACLQPLTTEAGGI